MAYREDNDQRRPERDHDSDRSSRYPQNEYRGGGRHDIGQEDRGYSPQYRQDGYGADRFGSERYGSGQNVQEPAYGARGGYGPLAGPGQRYQGERWGGQQQQDFSHAGGPRQGGAWNDDYGRPYGQGRQDRFGGGFYGDAGRFASDDERSRQPSRQGYDPDYERWRDEQVRNLDSDYESYRGERYKKFSDDFNTWRSSRDQGNPAQHGGSSKSKDASK